MKCIRCESQRVVKSGFKKLVRGKVQKYKCQECKKYFTGQESYHRLDKEKIALISKIYEEKGEQRKIARILGVGLATVQYHLKKNP
jgi:transposase-like protein